MLFQLYHNIEADDIKWFFKILFIIIYAFSTKLKNFSIQVYFHNDNLKVNKNIFSTNDKQNLGYTLFFYD